MERLDGKACPEPSSLLNDCVTNSKVHILKLYLGHESHFPLLRILIIPVLNLQRLFCIAPVLRKHAEDILNPRRQMHPTLMHALPEGGETTIRLLPVRSTFFSKAFRLSFTCNSILCKNITTVRFSLFPIHTNPVFFGLIQVRITFGCVRARASAFVCASTEHLSCFLLPFFLRS